MAALAARCRHAWWAAWQALHGEQLILASSVPAALPPAVPKVIYVEVPAAALAELPAASQPMLAEPQIVTQVVTQVVHLHEPDALRFKVDVHTLDGATRCAYIGDRGVAARDAFNEGKHVAHLQRVVMYDKGDQRCEWRP